MSSPTQYAVPLIAAAIASLALALFVWKRRPAPGATALAMLTMGVVVWSLASAVRVMSDDLQSMAFWHAVEVIGMTPIAVSWFALAASYAGRADLVGRRTLLLLAIVPLTTLVLAISNGTSGLLWEELSLDHSLGFPVLVETHSSWWWVDTIWGYTLVLVGMGLLAYRFGRSPRLYRRQLAALILAAVFLLTSDAVYVFGLLPPPQINMAPVSFTIVGIVLFWGFFRYHLFDVLPAAREFVVEHMTDSVLVTDTLSRVVDMNPAAAEFLGATASDVIGRPVHEVFVHLPRLIHHYEDGESAPAEIVVGERAERRIYHLRVSPLVERRRQEKGRLLVLRDITEMKQAEEALQSAHDDLERRVEERTAELRVAVDELRRSKGRLQHLLLSSPAVIYSRQPTPPFSVTFVSDNVVQQLGFEGHQFVLDSDFWERQLHIDDGQVVAGRAAVLERGYDAIEYRFLHKDGTFRWIHDEMRLVRDGRGEPFEIVGSWVDVTDRRKIEEQLRQTHKMQAVGLLAGGIAHDFNNLLTAVFGNSAMLLRNMEPDDELRHEAEEIQRAAERAAGLTRQLLAFSRRQVLQPKVIQLNDVVSRMSEMFRRIIGEDVELIADLDPCLGAIKADPGQIEQVCMNLVVNARDAMPSGGRLTLRSRRVERLPEALWATGAAAGGPYVLLEVSDTGHGMDEATRARLFEPFFSTKPIDRGTGLGLSTVYGIVSQSGGHIQVESELGLGATFRVFLPEVSDPVDPSSDVALFVPREREAQGRLLVVEDEVAVRRLASRALREQGYEVFEASGGEEALGLVARERLVDLMITDMVMPNISGQQLAREVRERYPDLKVMFISGYAREGLGDSLSDDAVFLEKPFTPEVLVAKVREVLMR